MHLALFPLAQEAAPAAGVAWWLYAVVAAVVVAAGAGILLVAARRGGVGPGAAKEELCGNCGKVMMPDWPRCMFCKTPRGFTRAGLSFTRGPMTGTAITLDEEVTTIGSAPGATVVIADAGVSRRHAGIRRAEGGFELADLGSTNGVYVNGEKVARRKLQLGDVIRIGASEMVFRG